MCGPTWTHTKTQQIGLRADPSDENGEENHESDGGKSQQERTKVRSKLGPLKGLTVQPRTRQRYTAYRIETPLSSGNYLAAGAF